jgi:SAM-dependent MidA family methyltransferase
MSSLPPELPPIADDDFDLGAGLGSETDNAGLRSAIDTEIRSAGRIPFRRFMEMALYQPADGYYMSSNNRIGRAGDYVTSPEITPLFGYAVARQIAELWRALDRPASFAITEYAAGSGRLAWDILRWTEARDKAFYDALTYQLVERSPERVHEQTNTLEAYIQSGKCISHREPPSPAAAGSVLANELLDSFPVHRVVMHNGRLEEIYVTLRDGAFVEELGPLSTAAIAEYFRRLDLLPGEDCVAEVNLEMSDWLSEAADRITRGYILLLDYGFSARRLYAGWRRKGTLLCYHRHDPGEDPYRRVGRQDMTAHVDFTSLLGSAARLGLTEAGVTSQARFLSALGIESSTRMTDAKSDLLEYYARRRAVEMLVDSSGLGQIKAVLLAKKAPTGDFSGFRAPAALE